VTSPTRAASPPCPVCGASGAEAYSVTRDVEYFSLPGDFRFLKCTGCGALFINPMPREHLAEIYPPNYYSFTHALDSPVYRVKQWLDARLLRGLLRSLKGDSLSALDVGGGTGWQLSLLQKIDPRVRTTQVVDIDADAEAGAQELGHKYFHGRIQDFRTDQKFDLVLMLNLIEHVDDPVGILRSTRELLTPQGIILVKTPNVDSLDHRIFRHRHWAGYHCPRHWVLFTRETFENAARLAGLKFREFRYTQGAPFWSGSLLNTLSTRGLIRVDKDHPMLSHWLSTPLFAVFAGFDFLRMPFSKTSQMFVVLQDAGR
jgi:SAM-dependent methyltransferase